MIKFYKIFFSIICIFVIYKLYNINININIIEQLSIKSLIFYLLFFVLSLLIISLRWLLIISDVYKINFTQSIKITLLSFSLNTASLSGSGDLFKVFLWNKKIKKNELFQCLIVEKLFGFLTFLLFVLIFLLIYFLKFSLLKIFLFISIYLLAVNYLLLNNFFIKKIPYVNYYDFFLKNKILKNLKKSIIIFLLSFFIQILYYLNLFIFAYLNYKELINIYSLVYFSIISLANSIPFFFSGFGIREFFTAIFVNFFKINSTIYFNFILIIGLLNFFLAVIILFFRFIIKTFYFRSFDNISKYKS